MKFDFSGRVAIVTGGAGGIGTATVHRLLESGARVAAFDRDQGRLDAAQGREGRRSFHSSAST